MTGTVPAIVVTVDLELDVHERSNLPKQRELAAVTRQLLELAETHRIALTWAVADPALSAATDAIRSTSLPHEIAWLGDTTWIGVEAGRAKFARELARRTAEAADAGLNISTLALRQTNLQGHVDLLVKHGITAVRSDLTACNEHDPKSLHYGVWHFAAQHVLPSQGNLLSQWRHANHISTSLRRAAADLRLSVVGIDAPRLVDHGQRGIRQVTKLFRQLERTRDAGQIIIETLAQSAARLNRTPSIAPAVSILRSAA